MLKPIPKEEKERMVKLEIRQWKHDRREERNHLAWIAKERRKDEARERSA